MLNLKNLNKTAYTRPVAKKVEEALFDKYVRITLEKLDRSISDAKGRYVDGKAYGNAKPSQNWKVVKTDKLIDNGESLASEVCRIWLKIGIRLVDIAPAIDREGKVITDENGDVVMASFTDQPSSELISTLELLRDSVVKINNERKSEEAKVFAQMAIDSGKPKSAPSQKTNPGKTAWQYDGAVDRWIAVA